jgi:hypothetical protein
VDHEAKTKGMCGVGKGELDGKGGQGPGLGTPAVFEWRLIRSDV